MEVAGPGLRLACTESTGLTDRSAKIAAKAWSVEAERVSLTKAKGGARKGGHKLDRRSTGVGAEGGSARTRQEAERRQLVFAD